jgi:hypothetical protein
MKANFNVGKFPAPGEKIAFCETIGNGKPRPFSVTSNPRANSRPRATKYVFQTRISGLPRNPALLHFLKGRYLSHVDEILQLHITSLHLDASVVTNAEIAHRMPKRFCSEGDNRHGDCGSSNRSVHLL